jgi:hypothetical protein
MKDNEIDLSVVERNALPLSKENTLASLQAVCEKMDIPTPILTDTLYKNIERFNFIKFLPTDFIESVDFDCLLVEYFV